MTRYFVNYIDSDEVRALRETEHERPIGKYEDGEEIMSHLGNGCSTICWVGFGADTGCY